MEKPTRLPYTRICAIAMERFHLTRVDFMRMSWTEVVMLFDATYDDEDEPRANREEVRVATEQDWKNWL